MRINCKHGIINIDLEGDAGVSESIKDTERGKSESATCYNKF